MPGYGLATFLEEEEFSHPQVPQILAGAGYQYATLAQVDTWGRAGVPELDLNVFHWQGIDWTSIPARPRTSSRTARRTSIVSHPLPPKTSGSSGNWGSRCYSPGGVRMGASGISTLHGSG